MNSAEQAVRDAAVKFHEALAGAKKVGLAVTWPLTVDGLLAISISETKKAAADDTPAAAKVKVAKA